LSDDRGKKAFRALAAARRKAGCASDEVDNVPDDLAPDERHQCVYIPEELDRKVVDIGWQREKLVTRQPGGRSLGNCRCQRSDLNFALVHDQRPRYQVSQPLRVPRYTDAGETNGVEERQKIHEPEQVSEQRIGEGKRISAFFYDPDAQGLLPRRLSVSLPFEPDKVSVDQRKREQTGYRSNPTAGPRRRLLQNYGSSLRADPHKAEKDQ
jgi:hypothetical protein